MKNKLLWNLQGATWAMEAVEEGARDRIGSDGSYLSTP